MTYSPERKSLRQAKYLPSISPHNPPPQTHISKPFFGSCSFVHVERLSLWVVKCAGRLSNPTHCSPAFILSNYAKSDSLALKDTSSIISSSVCPEPLTISQNSTNSSNWMCPSLLKSTVSKNTLADIAPNLVLFQCFYASLRSIVLLPSLSKMLKTSVTAFVSSGLKSYQIISQ